MLTQRGGLKHIVIQKGVQQSSFDMQASVSILQAIVEQLVTTVIPKLIPNVPLVPSVNSVNNVLLFPSLLFVTAMCKKQKLYDQVTSAMFNHPQTQHKAGNAAHSPSNNLHPVLFSNQSRHKALSLSEQTCVLCAHIL